MALSIGSCARVRRGTAPIGGMRKQRVTLSAAAAERRKVSKNDILRQTLALIAIANK